MHIIIHQMPHVFAGVHEPLKAHLWKPMLKKKKKKKAFALKDCFTLF